MEGSATPLEKNTNAHYQAAQLKWDTFQTGNSCSTGVPSLKYEEALAWYASLFESAPAICEDRTGTLGYENERDGSTLDDELEEEAMGR